MSVFGSVAGVESVGSAVGTESVGSAVADESVGSVAGVGSASSPAAVSSLSTPEEVSSDRVTTDSAASVDAGSGVSSPLEDVESGVSASGSAAGGSAAVSVDSSFGSVSSFVIFPLVSGGTADNNHQNPAKKPYAVDSVLLGLVGVFGVVQPKQRERRYKNVLPWPHICHALRIGANAGPTESDALDREPLVFHNRGLLKW